MISMYAEYSGRTLYVALSSDTIDGAKNGDTLYEMDTGKRYVYNESNDAWDEQPEEGGGGGGDTVEYIDVTVRAINNTGTGRLPVYYWTETDGVLGCTAVALELNTNVTMHTQVINGNVQLTAQSSTVGWIPYYNNEPLELLNNSNRSLGFKLPPEYTPGEIITIIH